MLSNLNTSNVINKRWNYKHPFQVFSDLNTSNVINKRIQESI